MNEFTWQIKRHPAEITVRKESKGWNQSTRMDEEHRPMRNKKYLEKHPSEDVLLALRGEEIIFKINFENNAPDDNPAFLVNGGSEPVGRVFGARWKSDPLSANFNTTIRFDNTGTHIIHGIWSIGEERELEQFDTFEEIIENPNYGLVQWRVHVFSQAVTLESIRQVIDDMIRAGTVAWGAKKFKKKLDKWYAEREDEGEQDEENHEEPIQDVLTNYDSR